MSKPKPEAPVERPKSMGEKLHNTQVYVRQHWQSYVLFMLPAFALTIIFRYIPMGGVLIAFQDYNPFKGILPSTACPTSSCLRRTPSPTPT